MKSLVRSVSAAAFVAAMLAVAPLAKADTVSASIWELPSFQQVPHLTGDAASAGNNPGSAIYSTTPTLTATIVNSDSTAIFNFYSGDDSSINGFLTTSAAAGHGSNGDTVTLSGPDASVNNTLFEFQGTTDLSVGTYSFSHDDGLLLYLNNSLVIDAGGPTSEVSTPFVVCATMAAGCNAVAGNYNFTLLYAEVDGAPAALTATLPLNGTAPTPEPGSIVLLGSSLLGAAGMLRRRMKRS